MSASPPDEPGACFAPCDVAGTDRDIARPAWRATDTALSHDAADSVEGARILRDLRWLMRSPGLLSPAVFGARLASPIDASCFGPDAVARLQDDLARFAAAPAALPDALAAAPERRLGRYAERLFAAWLRQRGDVDVVALGLPVREAGRTLGECDALFRTASGAREHWEMAVKFYLRVDDPACHPGGDDVAGLRNGPADCAAPAAPRLDLAGCDAYVGAGLTDRLDWKVRRLVEHQLPLSGHAGVVALGGGAWRSRMFVKGRIFHPLAQWRDVSRGPADAGALAPDHARGWWATRRAWRAASAQADLAWTPLARLEGLAALRVDAARAWSAPAFADWLERRAATSPGEDGREAGPVQVAALRPGDGTELSRGFIVPDDWPARARRFRRAASPYHQ